MLDALAPLMEVMEQFNSDAEEVSSEVITKAVENAIELLGNASSQMSSLRRTQVLQEYNKKLVAWTQHRRASSLRLFGQNFPWDVTEYLDQVASLKKAKAVTNPSSSFLQVLLPQATKQTLHPEMLASTLPTSASPRQSPTGEALQVTITDFDRCTCMSCFKVNHFKPYITESYGDGVSPLWWQGDWLPF